MPFHRFNGCSAARSSLLASLLAIACGAQAGPPLAAPASLFPEELATRDSASEAALTSSCAGLVPATPGSRRQVEYVLDSPRGSTACENAMVADGRGTVALPLAVVPDAPGGAFYTWNVLSADGTPLGHFEGGQFSREPSPQPSGFQLPDARDFDRDLGLRALGSRGEPLRYTAVPTETAWTWASAGDGAGGSVVVSSRCASASCGSGGWTLWAQRFDAQGGPLGPPGEVTRSSTGSPPGAISNAEPTLQVGVDVRGRTLVLWDGSRSGFGAGTLAGRWLDRAGAPLTAVFRAAEGLSLTHPAHLRPLLGGGMALQLDGAWVRRFPSGLSRSAPAPAWLAARPNFQLELLSGGRGYALVPFAGASAPACEQRVEILAPAGNACGGVTYPIRAGACRTAPLALGFDGTVLQRLPEGAPGRCGYQWWPRSLR